MAYKTPRDPVPTLFPPPRHLTSPQPLRVATPPPFHSARFFLAWVLCTGCFFSSPLVTLCILLFCFLLSTYNYVKVCYLYTARGFGVLALVVCLCLSNPSPQYKLPKNCVTFPSAFLMTETAPEQSRCSIMMCWVNK